MEIKKVKYYNLVGDIPLGLADPHQAVSGHRLDFTVPCVECQSTAVNNHWNTFIRETISVMHTIKE